MYDGTPVTTPPKTLLSALAVVAVVATACGSDQSAVVECEALIDAYCTLWASCTAPPNDAFAQQRSFTLCQGRASNILACADAESTSSRYDECLAEIERIACVPPFGFESTALPASCIGAIRLK